MLIHNEYNGIEMMDDQVAHLSSHYRFFFFQAEDGIRDHCVTGVQTCALPIWDRDPRAGGRLAARIAIRRGVPAVPPHRPSVHSVRGVDMKSLRPALALILVAPLVAEILPGSAPLPDHWMRISLLACPKIWRAG